VVLNTSKAKGSRTERELLHIFWKNNWMAIRVAGSGVMPFPCPDLLVGKKGRSLAIECKSGKTTRYIEEKQLNELIEFAKGYGAESWIGIRFNNMEWRFLKPNQLGRTNGNNFFISKELALKKGINFKRLIK